MHEIHGCVHIIMRKMKVIFKQLNPEKFAELIFDMKECLSEDQLNNDESFFSFHIPVNLAKEILASEHLTNDLKNRIIFHVKNLKQIDKKTIERLQEYWDKNVNDLFFNEMEKFMPCCSASEYICYVTDKMVSSYFEDNNEVVLDIKFLIQNKDEAWLSSVVAEEILHLIYWKFWKNLFNKNMSLDERFDIGNDKINGWSISEIIPDYLLIENKTFHQLGWNNINRWENIDKSKRYKWIKDLRKKLDPLWLKKKDFSDFVFKAHSLCGFKK